MNADDWFLRTFAHGVSEIWCITHMTHIAILYMVMDELEMESD